VSRRGDRLAQVYHEPRRSPFLQPQSALIAPPTTTAKAAAANAIVFTRFRFIDLETATHPFGTVEFGNGFVFFDIAANFEIQK
jgi:hypothetical protein